MKFINRLKGLLYPLADVGIRKKIVVFESDDWGSIRSTRESYNALKRIEHKFERDLYGRYDHLERVKDLEGLFDILSKYKDNKERHPVFTANMVVANPDFDRIRKGNFSRYYYELITDSYSRYEKSKKVMNVISQGLKEGLFKPQFHGREHVNFINWMIDLRKKDKVSRLAFDYGVFSYPTTNLGKRRDNHMAAFDFSNQQDLEIIIDAIEDGLDIFESLFNYKSRTIIAPCYVWSKEVEQAVSLKGVNGIQGIRFQFEPNMSRSEYVKKTHFSGQENYYNQKYIVRNAFFEPTHFGVNKSVNNVLNRMKFLFLLNKPVVIGSHRINYMGGIHSYNRTKNLKGLEILLQEMLIRYPDIEFVSSDELIDMYP